MKNKIHRPMFLTKLDCSPLDDGIHWRINKPLKFRDSNGDLHVVHTGFISDFASIPPLAFIGGLALCFSVPFALCAAWLHWLTPLLWMIALTALAIWVVIISKDFNCDDSGASLLDAPSVLHDDGYKREHLGGLWSQIQMKQYWDGVLYEAMIANHVKPFTANAVWIALLLFGWFSYFGKSKSKNHLI